MDERRHQLLETFLHRVLGVPLDEVHDEAVVLAQGLVIASRI